MRLAALVTLLSAAAIGSAGAQTIEGRWTVQNGETVTFAPCPQGFCSVIDSGEYAGGSVGWMAAGEERYEGEVVDPETGKTYQGHATVEGDVLTLTGCVATIFCRSQIWTR